MFRWQIFKSRDVIEIKIYCHTDIFLLLVGEVLRAGFFLYWPIFLLVPVGEVLPAVGDDVPRDAVLGRERTRAWTESGDNLS